MHTSCTGRQFLAARCGTSGRTSRLHGGCTNQTSRATLPSPTLVLSNVNRSCFVHSAVYVKIYSRISYLSANMQPSHERCSPAHPDLLRPLPGPDQEPL